MLLIALAMVLYHTTQVQARTSRVIELESAHLVLYEDLRALALMESGNLAGYYTFRDEKYATGFNSALATTNQTIDHLSSTIAANDVEDRARVAELRAAHDRLAPGLGAVMERLTAHDLDGAMTVAAAGDIFNNGEAYSALLGQATDAEQRTLVMAQADDRSATTFAQRVSLGIGGALVLLVVVAWFMASRWIVRPIERVGLAARSISAGDEGVRCPIGGPLEVARLGGDVNRMANALISRASRIEAFLSLDLEQRTADLERSETHWHDSEQRFRSLVQNATDMVTILEADGTFRYGSPAVERLLGRKPDALIGVNVAALVHPADREAATLAFVGIQERPGIHPPLEFRMQHADGSWRLFEAIASNLLGDPVIHGIVFNSRDVTERKRVEEQLVVLAGHDQLTGLLNNRRLREELARCITEAERAGRQGAVIFLDIDQFKDVNDTLGHAVGDDLLVQLAEVVRAQMRDGDQVGRIGGDEFILVMASTDLAGARIASERLLDTLRRHTFLTRGGPLRITASLGIAMFPDHGTHVDELLSASDLAMYRSKSDGRNRVTVYLHGMESLATERLSWHHRLREALDADRFVLYAQPIVDLRTNEVAEFELLLRLRGDDGSIILPGEFLASADRLGLLHEIDRWVVRQAVRVLAMSRQRGLSVRIGANISPRAFGDPGVLDAIRDEVAATRVDPSLLVLEVTEDSATRDVEESRCFMEALRQVGCRFALDDFGVGFSSLARLKELPVAYLKIDGSFITDLSRSPVDQRLVRSMVGLARALGMETVAEYVEDAETLELLRKYGVDFAQGFYLGKPAPVTDCLLESCMAA